METAAPVWMPCGPLEPPPPEGGLGAAPGDGDGVGELPDALDGLEATSSADGIIWLSAMAASWRFC